MDLNLFKTVKPKQIEIKANSLQELAQSLADIISEDNLNQEKIFNIYHEYLLYNFTWLFFTIQQVTMKIEDIHGIEVDLSVMIKQAKKDLDAQWEQMKKDLIDNADLANKLNDVFKDKDAK